MPRLAETMLAKVRALCLSFPEASERASHGAPTFFVREKKSFLTFTENHHGDGRIAIWCAAPEGAQAELVEAAPEHYFVPAYVGHLGWVGMRLDRKAPWGMIADTITSAYVTRAPRALAAKVRGEAR